MRLFLCLSLVLLCHVANAQSTIMVSEINYHSDVGLDSGDWIELHNYGTSTLNLSGWRIADDNDVNFLTLPFGTGISAGGYLVIADNLDKFSAIHPSVTNVLTEDLPFNLNNDGEQIRLVDNVGNMVINFFYADSLAWPEGADGHGLTLESYGVNNDPGLPESWFDGCMGGSPGTAFVACPAPAIMFSELNYNSLNTNSIGDFVELWNTTNATINLSGYTFKDQRDSNAYVFPTGTTLAADARLVLSNNIEAFLLTHPTVSNYIGTFDFNLAGDGEVLRLYNASDELVLAMVFDDDAPWPTDADGLGYTLELNYEGGAIHLSNGNNWIAGCLYGSPGVAYHPDCSVGIVENAIASMNFDCYNTLNTLHICVENLQQQLKVEVFSITGSLLYNGRLPRDGNIHIATNNWSAGLYVVVLRDSHHGYINKVYLP